MSNHFRSAWEIASAILDEPQIGRRAREGGISPAARAAHDDYARAIRNMVEAGDSFKALQADMAERGHRMPRSGVEHELRVGREKAESDRLVASAHAKRSLAALKNELESSALPKIDPSREALARQELAVALSAGDPAVEALRVAATGSEAAAVLVGSSYGETLLRSKGVGDPARVIAEARATATAAAPTNGATVRQVESGKVLRRIGRLAAAQPAAWSALSEALDVDRHHQAQLARNEMTAREADNG
jgi:hypothetical protein